MNFNYSEKHLKEDLVVGILQISIGIIALIIDSSGFIFQYGFILLGVIKLSRNYKSRKAPYLILQNQTLLIQHLFGYKKIQIAEYNEVEKKNKYLILKSNKKKKKIWTWLAEKNTSELLYQGINKIISQTKETQQNDRI